MEPALTLFPNSAMQVPSGVSYAPAPKDKYKTQQVFATRVLPLHGWVKEHRPVACRCSR